jgi:hypothetical protein
MMSITVENVSRNLDTDALPIKNATLQDYGKARINTLEQN